MEQIQEVLVEIIHTETDSFFDYEIVNIKEEQLEDHYSGFSCMIDAVNKKVRLHFKLDISNNTLIYPKGIEMNLHSFINDEKINVMTYPIENIIAEKYETTLDRGEFNTRMRDLFDVHYLFVENHHLLDDKLLAQTIIEVSKNRNTYDNLLNFDELLNELFESKVFNDSFNRYKKNNYVYKDESLIDIFETFKKINELVQKEIHKKKS